MRTINTISFFSGTAMLDRGADLAANRLGYRLRTIAYIEREKFPKEILVARQHTGHIDVAPIFPDVTTFDGRRLRGIAQAGIAGFPCQPFSFAGKRAGTEDERYLFGEVVRVADEAALGLLFLENVPGLLSPLDRKTDQPLPAPVGDVARLLSESGFRCQWVPLAAEDVGAPHGRERWWCVAWRTVARELENANSLRC